MAKILGIDVGGSGIKAALVDTVGGELVSERRRIATPDPSTPQNVAATVKRLVAGFDYSGTVGCCFPAVVIDGQAKTAGNIDKAWRNTQIDTLFGDATGLPFVVLNDADAAGMAEMTLGAGIGLQGMVIMITIGTGLGSGVFYNGQLIPNIELGRMPGKDGEPIEFYAGNRARKVNDLSWVEWAPRFNYFLERTARVFSPDHFILGGGASTKFRQFEKAIKVPTTIHVARFLNNAGIIGAAVAADKDNQ
ncbi:MAG: ROK family protein [Gammaproteobacteria bacterium]|nr:ROK family protein [Gammaproteobacteria bacterium]MBU2676887.1 ROK family protein [Gammaproteobacteria bacterium]NNC56700.1 ROK family protein [Woeseiaceae bacterium]NNL50620.1 ROK family protein [Woeseiaceae bacterium]